jgi:aminoglycoside 3'-phosphotransferase II
MLGVMLDGRRLMTKFRAVKFSWRTGGSGPRRDIDCRSSAEFDTLRNMQLPPIPTELQKTLRGYVPVREAIGKSGDAVVRLEAPSRQTLIIKIFDYARDDHLQAEATRIDWLRSVGIQVPRVLDAQSTTASCWLVMECLPGTNAAVAIDKPAVKVHEVAAALACLHSVSAGACPFDETLSTKIARAKINVENNQVDVDDFDEVHSGVGAKELFQAMQELRPDFEEIVVTHGDASLPNMMLNAGKFAGFVDCGKVGRADRYQDLALACRSIKFNLGPEWVGPFLRSYGVTSIDEERMRFYRMLDEFF